MNAVPIAGLALIPLLFGLPLLFGPIHIALLEMVIDPVCALVFEAEEDEADIMARPPRAPDEALFSLRMIAWSVFQGGAALAMLAAVLFVETANAMPETELRALMFFALIAAVLALTFVNRSFSASLGQALLRPNPALRVVLLAIVAITGAILFIPAAQTLLKFGTIAWGDMALAVGLGALLLALLEAGKFLLGRFLARRGDRTPLFREGAA